MANTKLPKSVIAALKNVSRRLSLEQFDCGNDSLANVNGEIENRTQIVKDGMKLYLCQDTKGIVDFLVSYGEGKSTLEDNKWIETL